MNQNELETVVKAVVQQLQAAKGMKLETAKALIEEVEKEAKRIGVRAVIAVSDASGRPIAVHCMDGSYIGSYDIAVNKTYTSIAFQMPTKELAKLAAPGGSLYGIQHTNEGKIVIFGGGEVLFKNGQMVGAVGISGGTAQQDTKLGEFAKNIFENNQIR